MGNTHSAQLHSNRILTDSKYKKEIPRINKYASPEHKVLPGPVSGQKLKLTNNGNILSNGGTISGRKFERFYSFEDSDPEVLAILNKRSALVNDGNEDFQNSKRYHSDPDLSSHASNNGNLRNDNRCPSKARINRAKRKKSKAHAPPAPPPISTIPRDFERIPVYQRKNDYKVSKERKNKEREHNKKNVSRTKSPAPKPPSSTIKEEYEGNRLTVAPTAPAPPPLPDSFGKPSGTRYSENTTGKERKLNNLNKNSDNQQKIENIKPNLDVNKRKNKKLSPNERFNQSLQDDIKAAVQKRLSSSDESETKKGPITPLKQYYFSGNKPEQNAKDKRDNRSKFEENKSVPNPPQQYYFGANITAVNDLASKVQLKHKERESRKNDVVTKAIVERTFSTSEDNTTETKRFEYSPNEKRRTHQEKLAGQKNKKEHETSAMHSWYDFDAGNSESKLKSGGFHRPRSLSTSSSECDPDIRMDLRPIVPAKRAQNLPKFSPTQAWRSLSVDSIVRDASNERSSDDTDIGENRITRSSRANEPIRRSANKSGDSGIFPDADSSDPAHEYKRRPFDREEHDNSDSSNQRSASQSQRRLANENSKVKNRSQWTPEQDLSDDCCDSPTFENSSLNPIMVNVQPKLVTPAAFSSMPYINPQQYPSLEKNSSLNEDFSMSPSEKVREKTRRGGRRRSKSSKPSKNDSSQPSSLQNFKNSMIAVLSINRKNNDDDRVDSKNWSLSRSIPNSLNELELDEITRKSRGREPVRRPNKPSYMASLQDHPELLLFDDNYRSLPQLNRLEKAGIRKGHVVYLPEYKTVQIPGSNRRPHSKSRDADRNQDICGPDPIEPHQGIEDRRRLWFRSTMAKEMQEMNNEKQPDWMHRVEEEFKSKRDREKADIRQQLRIFNLEHKRSNLSIDDTAVNSSDSQEPDSPIFDYRRYRSRSEDGFLAKSPDFNESRTRSRSYHELRDEPSGTCSMPVILPPPPHNSLPPLDFFFEKKRYQDNMSTSSPTSSSHASYTKQDISHSNKGISKWFRKKPKDEEVKHSLNLPTRPDPEGCRSSSEENKDSRENKESLKKDSKRVEPVKRPSIYKQLNELVEREDKIKEQSRMPSEDQSPFSRLNSSNRINSAGESYSESDVEVRNSRENLSRPRSRQYIASKDSITSSEDGHAESGFYSSSDRKKPSEDVSKRYFEYSGNYGQNKVPLGFAQPFTASKGYRPVLFNPTMKPFVK